MTTATADAPPGLKIRWAVSDALTVTRRNLVTYTRLPQLLVFSTIQPVMFVLLFAYVFGGAIATPGGDYIQFLIPGIMVQTVAFGSTQTGVGLADDLSKGIIDRFRSLPMARSAVLAGRTLSDSMRNLFVILLMLGVGTLIGFRVQTNPLAAMAAVGVALLFGFAFSWISATIGMSVGNVETAQVSGFIWIFPLVFASSVFVPVETMPGWLQAFAEHQPITLTVNALRALLLGGETTRFALGSIAWSLAILAVFMPIAVRKYRQN
jgi:ABC-2 type transport system permease protein/oleandomycin transport system permease protein